MTLDELEKEGYIKRLPEDKKKFAELFLRKGDVIVLDRMRRKRHATIYDTAGTISIREAENAVERAEKLVHEIERMLKENEK